LTALVDEERERSAAKVSPRRERFRRCRKGSRGPGMPLRVAEGAAEAEEEQRMARMHSRAPVCTN
jgi:hypothetical protein